MKVLYQKNYQHPQTFAVSRRCIAIRSTDATFTVEASGVMLTIQTLPWSYAAVRVTITLARFTCSQSCIDWTVTPACCYITLLVCTFACTRWNDWKRLAVNFKGDISYWGLLTHRRFLVRSSSNACARVEEFWVYVPSSQHSFNSSTCSHPSDENRT